MRNDFSPLFRSSIGFDRLFNLLETAGQAPESWPPYDIAKHGEDGYRITMAVAGFAADQLTVTCLPNLLVVSGARPTEGAVEYLHQGISQGRFESRFELADYVKVTGASLANGLLTIDLMRELPEEMKPRKIEIRLGSGQGALGASQQRRIGEQKQAA